MKRTWPVEGLAAEMLQRTLARGRLAHAYLFVGPEGAGMAETATHFAKGILCERNGSESPCGECNHCRRVESGNHPDLSYLEPEGQSIKIQQIREIQKSFAWKALEASRKVYIITRADALTAEASNALLKFLEEPATPVAAILLANRKAGLLPTVISRCQMIPFDRVSVKSMQQHLQNEGLSAEQAKLLAHVKESIDSARKFSVQEKFAEILNLVVQLSEELVSQRGNPLFLIQDKIGKPGWTSEEVESFLDCLAWWYRDVLTMSLQMQDQLIYQNQISRIQSQAAFYRSEDLVHMVEKVLSAKKRLQSHANQQLLLEQMVLELQEESS